MNKTSNHSKTEDDLYQQAYNEIQTGELCSPTWARALALADGDKAKAESAYLRLRVQHLVHQYSVTSTGNHHKTEYKSKSIITVIFAVTAVIVSCWLLFPYILYLLDFLISLLPGLSYTSGIIFWLAFIFVVVYFDSAILKVSILLVGLYSVWLANHIGYAWEIENIAKQEETASKIVKYLHDSSEVGAYLKGLNYIAGCNISLQHDSSKMSYSDLFFLQRKIIIYYEASFKCPVLGIEKSRREKFYVVGNQLYAHLDNKEIYLFNL